MFKKCSDRVDFVADRTRYDRPVLSDRSSRRELERLQNEYVITVVDKAAGNFAFMCRKFYFLRLAQELGLDRANPGNGTYSFVDETEADVCGRICRDLLKFRVTPRSEEVRLAILYQTLKFHKDPPKMRYIAGNVATLWSQLDGLIAKVLKMCKGHFRNLCRKSDSYNGIT